MKKIVKTVEPIYPKFKSSIENILPVIEIMISINDNDANVFMNCSANKSSGSIISFGDFLLASSFKVFNISLSISGMSFPLNYD